MVLNNIEHLLEKYENGETTLKEEQQLKDYFLQESVEPHLEMYKPIFQYFTITKQEQFTKDVPLKSNKLHVLYKWISVAAVAVLMIGVYTKFSGPTQMTDNELAAYQQTKEALNLLSTTFNKGVENIAYVNTFETTTNKIFKTSK